MKTKSNPQPVKIIEESSDSQSDSEDPDSDGGAPLYSKPVDSEEEEEEEDGGSEATPKVADGLHPDRAKAVVTNGTQFLIF